MSDRGRIAIAGAGIAGLGTALALIEQGFEVRIFEQSTKLGEIGAGLQISPNGSRVLQHWGLEPELKPLVCEAAGKEIRLWSTGQSWKLFDLGEDCRQRFGAPYWMVHRGDLHQVLARAVQVRSPGSITLGARIVGAQPHGPGVRCQVEGGTFFEADALIAADGVHSLLRQQCLGQDKPHFMDLLAWRGLVPMQRLPQHLRRPVGTNWVGPGAHVITYPLQGGALMNVVGIVERSDWRGESWTEPGSHEELLRDFGRWHEDVQTLMSQIDQPYKWALLGREPRRGWARGPVCLVGDAAHPTLPFLAQGANMALEDAAVMARCLAAAATPEQAFARFEALRWQRTADIVNRSRDNAQRFHNPQLADDAVAVAYVDREWQPESVRRRYDWLFEYDPLSVPL